MNVTCPGCRTVYRVDPGKIPEHGVIAQCVRCPAEFPIGTDGVRSPAAVAPAEAVSVRPDGGGSTSPDLEINGGVVGLSDGEGRDEISAQASTALEGISTNVWAGEGDEAPRGAERSAEAIRTRGDRLVPHQDRPEKSEPRDHGGGEDLADQEPAHRETRTAGGEPSVDVGGIDVNANREESTSGEIEAESGIPADHSTPAGSEGVREAGIAEADGFAHSSSTAASADSPEEDRLELVGVDYGVVEPASDQPHHGSDARQVLPGVEDTHSELEASASPEAVAPSDAAAAMDEGEGERVESPSAEEEIVPAAIEETDRLDELRGFL
jgi:predicted Zn finger-like uncharacterized protein